VLEDFNLHEGNDIWTYIWGSANFASNKAYLQLIGSKQVHQAYKWLWNSYCQPKRKFFFWLLLKDRLNTRELFEGKLWSWKVTIVLYVSKTQMNLSCTSSFIAHWQWAAGTPWALLTTFRVTSYIQFLLSGTYSSTFLHGNHNFHVLGYLDC